MYPIAYIIVLNWNGWRDTLACLAALEALNYPNYEVVVVDNGSTDGSAEEIRKAKPQVNLLETRQNLGFAGGNNIGIRYALEQGAEYIWLLNNDTVVDPDALTAMVELAEKDCRIGVVGSVLYYMEQPTKVQAWGGGRVNLLTGRSRHLLAPGEPHYITGASMLLRREALEQVGLLDEGFFMYWEDADLSFRLRQKGWMVAVAPESKVLHKESASAKKGSPRQDILYNASAVRFFRRHAQLPSLPITLGIGGRMLKRLLLGDWERVRSVWLGYRRGEEATR
ncbi:glycosyltransferase family 2 protein [Allomeiothermus silvanus]|uniref:glycosyltransferase family 2 protein n=1 Tax=Allomeiothermus silvanus TaxID=52022 RepID=UPI0023F591B8|nr:glycosyltransferase family 2 protein [Allomeiothermus silvanus]